MFKKVLHYHQHGVFYPKFFFLILYGLTAKLPFFFILPFNVILFIIYENATFYPEKYSSQ